jgi:hypothetical protein
MTHPDRVTELLIRGIFLLRKSEIDWYYQEGASHIFPDTWEIYKNAIPEDERHDFVKAYHRRLKGDMGKQEMHKAAIGEKKNEANYHIFSNLFNGMCVVCLSVSVHLSACVSSMGSLGGKDIHPGPPQLGSHQCRSWE